MGCYLCATGKVRTPERSEDERPASGAWQTGVELGTCWRCYVHACGLHGTRRGRFECAICRPAIAARRALGILDGPVDDPSPSVELARAIGESAAASLRERAAHALERVRGDEQRAEELGSGERSFYAAAETQPNLLTDLADVVRDHARADAGSYADLALGIDASPPPLHGDWLDSAASIAQHDITRRDPEAALDDDDAVAVITGALLMASSVAHEPATDTLDVDVLPPWRVPHPELLDPLMLLLTTAYDLAVAPAG